MAINSTTKGFFTAKNFTVALSFLIILVVFNCKKDPELPELTNKIVLSATVVDSLTYRDAQVQTDISNPDGIKGICGHCWVLNGTPSVNDQHTENLSINKNQTVTDKVVNLQAGSSYHVRAFFKSQQDTIYGAMVTITTLPRSKPSVATESVMEKTQTSAMVGGTVKYDGGVAVTERGVYWGTLPNPVSTGTKRSIGSGMGIFSENLTGLTPGTTYYIRAFATNSAGTGYGDELSFTTSAAVPTVITAVVTNITTTSAGVGGNVTSAGGGTVSERGVYWGTSPNPAATGVKLVSGSGTGAFSLILTGLNPGTLYYVKAYATNSAGPGYGGELSFTTGAAIPTVATAEVTNLTANTAEAGGNVTSGGGGTVTERGVYWGTSINPVSTGTKLAIGNGTGAFSQKLTGLAPGRTYYVKAYATNSTGTGYGDEKSFITSIAPTVTTTEITGITATTAASGGNVTNSGGSPVIARGVCWSTSPNPTSDDSKTTDGSGTGIFTSSITGLAPLQTYYVRAYATSSTGTGYGAEKSFATAIIPTVSTADVRDISALAATGGGEVTFDGNFAVIARGVCWSTVQNPTTADSKTTDGTGTGSFISQLTNLAPNTAYYVRAYAINSGGTAYGAQKSFRTTIMVPLSTTAEITAITATTAMSGGNVTSGGGATVTARGICWSTSQNPTLNDNQTYDGTGTGTFASSMTGLTLNTTYYVRAYSTNIKGVGYGNELSFKTKNGVPILTTTDVTGITFTSAVSGGNITDDGGFPITARGVCWGTTQNPEVAGSKTVDGTEPGSFTSNLTGLTVNTTYYVRAYATNSLGTMYGQEESFSTWDGGTFTDSRDSNVYTWVSIGTQRWMAENLAWLPAVSPPSAESETAPHYYVYGYEGSTVSAAKAAANYSTYGVLYNWPAALTACPSGWHLPSDAEWAVLTDYLTNNGYGYRGSGSDIGKSMASTSGWTSYSIAGTVGNDQTSNNRSGFAALPGGYSYSRGFTGLGYYANFWSASGSGSSYAWSRLLNYGNDGVYRNDDYRYLVFSVRCLQNE